MSTIRKILNKIGVYKRKSGKPVLPKKRGMSYVGLKPCGCSTVILGKSSVDSWDKMQNFWQKCMLCLEGKGHCTPTLKPHLNCEAWWKEHHGLTASRTEHFSFTGKTMNLKMHQYIFPVQQFMTLSFREVEWCNKTRTQIIQVIPTKEHLRKKSWL